MSFIPPPTHDFSAERMQRLAEIENQHFWFAGRKAMVANLLKRHAPMASGWVLDAGCGTGSLTAWLTQQGYSIVSLDARPEGLRRLTGIALPAQAAAEAIPLQSRSIHGLIALDLLEHTDDQQSLAEFHRVLAPGGWALLSVPAFPFLWSYRDEAAGHRRRYRRKALLALLEKSGFSVQSCRYYQFLFFPILAAARLLGRKTHHLRDQEDTPGGFVNSILTPLILCEVKLGAFFAYPYGSSLVVFCRKK